jgi:site-specific DNA-methyltransferase (adenine-specific)
MKTFPDNYVTTIITDPPYGLAFMGKEWDDFGTDLKKFQEWARIWAVEVFRVAKPGATLLCFGGTRTFHRLACGLEDAGWQIKDVLMWLHGQGFPKSLDISKAIDKLKGAEREIIGYRERFGREGRKANCGFKKEYIGASGTQKLSAQMAIEQPATQEAKEWEGYGTALKPAYEPIIMAIRPTDGSYANNALKWGVAGLNIDGGRIPTSEKIEAGRAGRKTQPMYSPKPTDKKEYQYQGRFPANVILDEESAELLDKQSDNASRFFYCAKASKSERTANGLIENKHPTLKPLELIKYLVKLATPPDGLVLDPFVGSGTTCVACKILGYDCIGIEKELNYIEIANKRLKGIKVNDVLF